MPSLSLRLLYITSKHRDPLTQLQSSPWTSHSYRSRSPKDVAVSHLIHLNRQHAALLTDLIHFQGRLDSLERAYTVRFRPPPSFVIAVKAATSAWVSLHSEDPSARLATSRALARFCSSSSRPPSLTSSTTHLTRPALLSLGTSLLPTPLALLDTHLNEHGILGIADFTPYLTRLVFITLDLHYLSLAQSLTGGDGMRSISIAEMAETEQRKALRAFAEGVEALEVDSSGRPCSDLAMAGLKLIKIGARAAILEREERRVEARALDGLLLVLCRWKEDKEARRIRKRHS